MLASMIDLIKSGAISGKMAKDVSSRCLNPATIPTRSRGSDLRSAMIRHSGIIEQVIAEKPWFGTRW